VFHTRKSLYDRCLEKTPEQVFVNSLRKEFELSPAASKSVLELAKECLFGTVPETIGQQKFICASLKAVHGRPLGEQEKVTVELTMDNGVEDLDVLRQQGPQALRQLKILRLTEETYVQGGVLTQEDLGRLLQVSDRTIREDVRDLVSDGQIVRTRGLEHDIGRTLTHKARIIDLYLSGHVYADIIRRSRHSAHSIKRYVGGFGRLLLLLNKGVTDIHELSRLLCQSEALTREYLALFEKYKKGDQWPKVYLELIEQLSVLYPSKKKVALRRRGGRHAA
jgi:hypothetical protein